MRPDFDCSSTFLPARKTMQRKPSHFGSYCQCLPTGIWSTDSASIGLNGGRTGKAIAELPSVIEDRRRSGNCREFPGFHQEARRRELLLQRTFDLRRGQRIEPVLYAPPTTGAAAKESL